MARTRSSITTGTTENNIYFYPAGGHSHDGQNSSLIDATKYSVYDFNFGYISDNPVRRQFQINSFESLKQVIRDTVTDSILTPAGIVLQPNTLNGATIIARTIEATQIVANTITANELAANIILVNNIIRSNNYSAGVSGWQISNTGSAEFNNVTVRGTVIASNGTIGGFTLSSNTLNAGSNSDQITISTGIYNAASNPDEIVIGIGGPLSNGFSLPFAVNSSGTLSAQVATIGPLQLDSSGLTSAYFNSNNYVYLNTSGDFYKYATRNTYNYLTYILGELVQIKRINNLGSPTGSGAFLGYYSTPDDARLILNSTSTPSYDSGTYVELKSDGTIRTSGNVSATSINVATTGNLSFGSQVRQMINLWSTSYGIGIQSGTQYFRTGSRFSWYTGGIHSDTENDPGTGGTRWMSLTSGGLRLYSGQFEYFDGSRIRSRLNFNSLLYWSVTGAQKSEYGVGGFYVDTGYVAGDFSVGGTKSFRIQHPLYEDKMLVHASLEGPTADVFYKGKAQLVNGEIEITLPDYFETLTKIDERIVMITPIIKNSSKLFSTLGATQIENGKFKVYNQENSINDNQEFYWIVQATRKDIEIEVEPLKNNYDLRASNIQSIEDEV
jgi:hypothetical protein